MTGYIYIHISPSNKAYIGQTTTSLEHRFNNGNNYIGSPVFWNAIQKYGWDSFEHRVLYTVEAESKEELIKKLNLLERESIKKYNSLAPNGYNVELGGGQGRVTKEKAMQISKTSLRGRAPDKKTLEELYNDQKLTLQQIGTKLNLSPEIVSKYLKWYDISINYSHRNMPVISKEELTEKYLVQNWTQKQISEFYDVRPDYIASLVNRYDIFKRKGKEIPYDTLKKLYLEENLTAQKCADILSVPYSRVRRYIIKYKLQKGGRGK